MPKKKSPNWFIIKNPETGVLSQLPVNRKARRAFRKTHNTDVVPPAMYRPFTRANELIGSPRLSKTGQVTIRTKYRLT